MRKTPSTVQRSGFTVLEVVLVLSFLGFLGYLVAMFWQGFGRPVVDLSTRTRILQECSLAIASLQRDLAGSLPDSDGRLGSKEQGQFVGRSQPGNQALWLCFDGGSLPDGVAWGSTDKVIVYEVKDGSLVRWDQSVGKQCLIARHVTSLATKDLGDNRVQIDLSFSYRGDSQTVTLIARDP